MARVLLSDAAMVGVLADNPLPPKPEHEARANRAANDRIAADLRRRLTSPPADPSREFEALTWGPEGRPDADYCGPFRDYTRERYEVRAKGDATPSVLWQGKRIAVSDLQARNRAAREFAESLAVGETEPAKPAPSGLVSSGTSAKRSGVRCAFDPVLARVRKMRKAVLTTARLHASVPRSKGFRMSWIMVTLTLRDDAEFNPRDVSNCIDQIRKWAKRHWRSFHARYGFRYTWVMELTKAGRPHWHLLLAAPYQQKIPKPDEQGWWALGSSRCEFARRAVGYLAKYASKLARQSEDHTHFHFPKGHRICGAGGLDAGARDGAQHREKRFWMAPHWAREAFFPFYSSARVFSPLLDLRRVVGGFVDRFTGLFEPCPWVVSFEQGSILLRAKAMS